jgi:hypothetical protein
MDMHIDIPLFLIPIHLHSPSKYDILRKKDYDYYSKTGCNFNYSDDYMWRYYHPHYLYDTCGYAEIFFNNRNRFLVSISIMPNRRTKVGKEIVARFYGNQVLSHKNRLLPLLSKYDPGVKTNFADRNKNDELVLCLEWTYKYLFSKKLHIYLDRYTIIARSINFNLVK